MVQVNSKKLIEGYMIQRKAQGKGARANQCVEVESNIMHATNPNYSH